MTTSANELLQTTPHFTYSEGSAMTSTITFTTIDGASVTAALPRTTHLHSIYDGDTHTATVADVASGTVTQQPALAPTDASAVSIQLGSGALAIGLLVVTYMLIKQGKWAWSQILSGFALGTILAAAQTGILAMPAQVVTSLFTSLGTSLGTL